VITKHKLYLVDGETVAQIQENPYLQYFAGLACYQAKQSSARSLFVEIRKRMGVSVFDTFHRTIISAVDSEKQKRVITSESPPISVAPMKKTKAEESAVVVDVKRYGELILDATVSPSSHSLSD